MCHVNCNENGMNIYIYIYIYIFYVWVLKKFGMIYSDLDSIYLYACKHDFDCFCSNRIS